MISRGLRYKLAPTAEQEQVFRQHVGACRLIYNIALEQRQTFSRRRRINFATQGIELTQLRKEYDWLAAISYGCQSYALKDLENAFQRFFAGKSRYPTPRKRRVNDTCRFKSEDIIFKPYNAKWSAVRLPKIGWVKFRNTRLVKGKVKNATLSYEAGGWHISFACEIEHEAPAPQAESVGIDRGVATTLALSTGEMLSLPDSLGCLDAQRRRAQRVLSRRKKGSRRRDRQKRRVAYLQARVHRIRRDWHHRAALDIARRFGVAVLEKLDTKSMTASAKGTAAEPGRNVRQKAGLNRSILNAGWNTFARILTYKMEERGGQVVIVPAQFTSQTCTACDVVDARSRESQARFVCVSCGHTAHADINAAINIERRWSTPLLDVEGCGYAPVEASTVRTITLYGQPERVIASGMLTEGTGRTGDA